MDSIIQVFSDNVLYATGWTVLHSLWQAALVAAVLGLLNLTFRNKAARVRYYLANTALFATMIISVVTFCMLYFGADNSGAATTLIEGTYESGATSQAGSLAFQFGAWLGGYFNQHLPLIVTLWLLGLVFFSLRLLGGLTYVAYLKRKFTQPLDEFWQQKLLSIAQKINLKRKVSLLESALVRVPMVIGFLKPVILMPIGTVNHLSVDQVEAILAHELAHIYRNDYLLNILQSIIETILYFNPAVWWISANIRTERENCCDDMAIRVCNSSLEYAKALVTLQELSFNAPAMAMPLAKNKNQLLNRVRRILNQPQNKSRIMEKLTATLLLLLAVVLFSFTSNDSTEIVQDTQELEMTEVSYNAPQIGQLESESQSGISVSDSIPEKQVRKKRMRLVKNEDGKTVEMTVEDDQVVELKIDGEDIPKTEIPNYKALTDQLRMEMATPPVPPAPPAPPKAPKAPEAPGATPPSPPAPPAPPKVKMQRIEVDSEGDGQTLVFKDLEGVSQEIEILLDEMGERVFLNGEELENLKALEKELQGQQASIVKLNMEKLKANEALIKAEMAKVEAEMAKAGAENARIKADMDRQIRVMVQKEKEMAHHGLSRKFDAALIEDGLIKDPSNYRVQISEKELIIDGKKQPNKVFKKYKALHDELAKEMEPRAFKWILKDEKEEY